MQCLRREIGNEDWPAWKPMYTVLHIKGELSSAWIPFRLEDGRIAWKSKNGVSQRIYDTDLLWQELKLAEYEQQKHYRKVS